MYAAYYDLDLYFADKDVVNAFCRLATMNIVIYGSLDLFSAG